MRPKRMGSNSVSSVGFVPPAPVVEQTVEQRSLLLAPVGGGGSVHSAIHAPVPLRAVPLEGSLVAFMASHVPLRNQSGPRPGQREGGSRDEPACVRERPPRELSSDDREASPCKGRCTEPPVAEPEPMVEAEAPVEEPPAAVDKAATEEIAVEDVAVEGVEIAAEKDLATPLVDTTVPIVELALTEVLPGPAATFDEEVPERCETTSRLPIVRHLKAWANRESTVFASAEERDSGVQALQD